MTTTTPTPTTGSAYGDSTLGLDRTPAADAIRRMAGLIADSLGTAVDDGNGSVDGILDVPVYVTEGGVFGEQIAVTLWREGTAEIVLDDDALPAQQLVALLQQLTRYCVNSDFRQ